MKHTLIPTLVALALASGPAFSEDAKKPDPAPGQTHLELGPISVSVSVSSSETGAQKTPYLGVVTEPLSPALRAQISLPDGMGLSVDAVAKDGPAEHAGIKQYDVLKKFNDQMLCAQEQLTVLVNAAGKGAKVSLTIVRGGKEQVVEATLGEHEALPSGKTSFSVNGTPGLKVEGDGLELQLGDSVLRGGLNGLWSALLGGQPKEASGGIQDHIEKNEKTIHEKQKEIQQEIQQHVQDEIKKALASGKSGSSIVVGPPQVFSFYPGDHSQTRNNIVLKDGDITVELSEADGKRTVSVTDASGQKVYSGPLNSPADHDAVPEKFRDKVKDAETRLKADTTRAKDAGGSAAPSAPAPAAPAPEKGKPI